MTPTIEQVEHELFLWIVNNHLTQKQGRAIIAELEAEVESWRSVGSVEARTAWLPWKQALLVEARRRIRT
mgnify:CR=1 FL=1